MQTIHVKDISCNHVLSADPNMIEFHLSDEFIAKARKCIDFMRTNSVREMKIEHAFAYEMYRETVSEAGEGTNKIVRVGDIAYIPFNPTYALEGCHAAIDVTGEVKALFPFRDNDGCLSCLVTRIAQ